MVRVPLLLVTMSLLWLVPGRAAAQAPVITRFVVVTPEAAPAHGRRVTLPADSARPLRKTWWLEAGIVGGVLMGMVAVSYASGLSESPLSVGDRAGAFLLGAGVGFAPAALIGGLIEKQ